MPDPVATSLTLEADARNVGSARHLLQDAMSRSGSEERIDDAVLVLSEIVTNAFVHTGAEVTVLVWSTPEGTRVEVEDLGAHLPVRLRYASTAGTGRGMQLVESLADRWGAHRRQNGKTVWFEIGQVTGDFDNVGLIDPDPSACPRQVVHSVTLRRAPLLMHWAWQEHAAALLREYLLHVLDEDDTILEQHAEASEAMSLLDEQFPRPQLPDQPEDLLANSLEPEVTADEVVLQIPSTSVAHFITLDDLLGRAVREAHAGHFLGPPTQPEITEMRRWICTEVAAQVGRGTPSKPWLSRTDASTVLVDRARATTPYPSLATAAEPLLATDEASIIVAVSPPALQLLGYDHADDLVGRRVLVVIPTRFHQAHIAGITLNATNGRDTLLGASIVVPMIRADGTEVPVQVEIRPERLDAAHRGFVARFQLA